MKKIVCVGLNHRRAPVELREKVAFTPESVERALVDLKRMDAVEECLILSTCNRVEVYLAGEPDVAPYQVSTFLQQFHGIDDGALDEHMFRLVGEDALKQLFRVSASLDAIVVGEPQILGQVKDAFFKAAGLKTTGPVLNRAFHKAFNVAKRVRTETQIASSAVSVSYAGVELARKIFGDLSGLQCLLVGAGDMAELAAQHFVERGANLLVCNRSFDRAHRLAEKYAGVAREWDDLPRLLEDVDVVLSSTCAPTFVITKDLMKKAIKRRKWRPLLLVDIAVPRDIDPAVGEFESTYVYDVDDLAQVVEENLETRQREAERAEEIVTQELLRHARSARELQAVPTIKALKAAFADIAAQEADRTLVVLGDAASEKQKKSVEKMAQAIVNKILHSPIKQLRDHSSKGDARANEIFSMVSELFALEIDDADGEQSLEAILKEAEAAEDALEDVPAPDAVA